MLHLIGNTLTTLFIGIGTFFGVYHAPQTEPVVIASGEPTFGAYAPTGGGTYRLGQSVGTTDSSIKLSSFTEPVSGIKYTMSYLGSDIGYGTISPQSSVSEFVSFTGITQNSDNSATLTGVTRGLTRTPAGSSCTASTTLAQPHAGQSIFILSNSPCLYSEYAIKRNNETVSGTWTYSATPKISNAPLTSTDAVNKAYADALSIQGAATSTFSNMGIAQLATRTQIGASTASSTEGRPLILTSNFSTTTCQGAGSGNGNYALIASSTSGKLDGRCLDTSSNEYTWTKQQTFSGTTTISASNINTNPLKLNGLAYTFQTGRAASSTVLSEDGSGNLTWEPQDWQLIVSTTTTAAMNTATTTITGSSQDLRVVVNVPSAISGTSKYFLTLNGDAGANYAATGFAFSGGQSSYALSAQGGIDLSDNGNSTTSPAYIDMSIKNVSTLAKLIQWRTSLFSSATVAPGIIQGAGQWNNTSVVISTIQIKLSGGNTMPIGTTIRVYGSGR